MKIMERVSKKNARNFHAKVKKKNMNPKQKKQRKNAQLTAAELTTHSKEGKSEYTGNSIAEAVGISSSQLSGYVDGRVADQDGDSFLSQEALDQFKRLHTDVPSSYDDDSGDDKEEGERGK